jgi:hypothetical protein
LRLDQNTKRHEMDEKLEAEWPCKKSFGLVPFEEIRKYMVAVACPVALAMRNLSGEEGSSQGPQEEAWRGS